jgi:DNA-binding MarR family transcriptional regulator
MNAEKRYAPFHYETAKDEALAWVERNAERTDVVVNLFQPMTANQLSRRCGLKVGICSHALRDLEKRGLTMCLSRSARRSRVYWLTDLGKECHNAIRNKYALPSLIREIPDVDWELYAWVCYSHRSAILMSMREPMQPATIRRVACRKFPNLKMSANNVRDVMKEFLRRGLIVKVPGRRKRSHPRYELSGVGEVIKRVRIST